MNNLIFLSQKVFGGSGYVAISIIAGLIIVGLTVLIGFKTKRKNVGAYIGFALVIVASTALHFVGLANKNPDMYYAFGSVSIVVLIFLFVFIFKWSKE